MFAGVRRYPFSWLIARNKGSLNRIKIIKSLHEAPQNANQLAAILEVDYKTVRHHLEILEKNKLVTSVGDKYGKTYFLSQIMENHFFAFTQHTSR